MRGEWWQSGSKDEDPDFARPGPTARQQRWDVAIGLTLVAGIELITAGALSGVSIGGSAAAYQAVIPATTVQRP